VKELWGKATEQEQCVALKESEEEEESEEANK
jgi:hypothetical protein